MPLVLLKTPPKKFEAQQRSFFAIGSLQFTAHAQSESLRPPHQKNTGYQRFRADALVGLSDKTTACI
jgi:hypothetical protein